MTIKKRYNLGSQVIAHIFDGEVSKNSFSGFHSEARKNLVNGKLIITQIDGVNSALRLANKAYRANVKIVVNGKTLGPEWKSIFPKDWSEADTVRWIEQSLTATGTPSDNVSKRASPKEWIDRPREFRKGTAVPNSNVLTRVTVNKVSCLLLCQGDSVESVYPNR
jgi:hypothetical protein